MRCKYYTPPQNSGSSLGYCEQLKRRTNSGFCANCRQREDVEETEDIKDPAPEDKEENNAAPDRSIRYEIKRTIAVLSTSSSGWTKELNLTSWNGNPAKLEIRLWNPDHSKCGKGITLNNEEARALREALISEDI